MRKPVHPDRSWKYRPAVLSLSGPGLSSQRYLSGAFLLHVKLDAPAYVAAETLTVRGWRPLQGASGTMHNSEQMMRFAGEQVRIVSDGTGTVEIRRHP